MRIITLTKGDIDLEYSGHGSEASFTGTDEQNGDRVTIVLNDGKLISALLGLIVAQGAVALAVADFQITNVEPTSGQWDSPGTSPEEEDV